MLDGAWCSNCTIPYVNVRFGASLVVDDYVKDMTKESYATASKMHGTKTKA